MLANTRRPLAGVFVLRLVVEGNIGSNGAEVAGFARDRLLGLIAIMGRVCL